MKIRKLFSKRETSSEPMRISNHVRCVFLQHYEPGMQKFNYSCLQFTPILLMAVSLRLTN